jgi:hypothetical protein
MDNNSKTAVAVYTFRQECLKELAAFCIEADVPFTFSSVDDGRLVVHGLDMEIPPGITPTQHVKNLLRENLIMSRFPGLYTHSAKKASGSTETDPFALAMDHFALATDEGVVYASPGPGGDVVLEVLNSMSDD